MCGRFTRRYSWAQLHKLMSLCFPGEVVAATSAPGLPPSYNAAPTQTTHAVRAARSAGALAAEIFCPAWGFSPHWMKDQSRPKPINARAETVATNGLFRSAFAKGRCIVPISSFYEWSGRAANRAKQPWHIQRADEEIILAAGVWTPGAGGERDEPNQPAEPNEPAEPPGTFAIITTPANTFMAELHDRMPAILEPESVLAWCDPDTPQEKAQSLLRPAPDGVLTAAKVSPRVNTVRNNDPTLIEPLHELF